MSWGITCQGQQFVSYENGRVVLVFIEGILPPIPQELLHAEFRNIREGNRTIISRIPWENENLTVARTKTGLLFSEKFGEEDASGEREAEVADQSRLGRRIKSHTPLKPESKSILTSF
jgi:hypothetical protein